MCAFFSKFGKVVDATVMVDHEMGQSKGFGFVTFEDNSNDGQLVGKLGLILNDKQIEVKTAQPRSQRDQQRHVVPSMPNSSYNNSQVATANTAAPMGSRAGMGGMDTAGGAAGMGAGAVAAAAAGMGMGMGMQRNMGMMGGGVGCGRPGMNQGPGPARVTNRGQYGFHSYAR